MSSRSQDDFPDDFQSIDWDTVDIPALGEPSSSYNDTPSSPDPSFCDDDDEISDAFLAEVDALEERITQEDRNILGSGLRTESSAQVPSTRHTSPRLQVSRFFPGPRSDPSLPQSPRQCQRTTLDHDTSDQKRRTSPSPGPSRKRGKMKSHGDTDHVRKILEGFEHEIICPICCDIFIATHLGNPCGHSFCGECGLKWISNNRVPTCAVCRSKLSPLTPMIPNFVVDNTVDKYVNCLSLSGNADWKPGGAKLLEWSTRKEQWKKRAVTRTSGAPRDNMVFNHAPVYVEVLPYDVYEDDEDDDSEDDDPENDELTFSIRPRQV